MLSPKSARILLIAVAAVWALIWFTEPFVDPFDLLAWWILVLPAVLGLLLATLFLIVDSVVAGMRGRGWRRLVIASAAVVLLVWPGWILAQGLTWLGAAARLRPHQQEYEQQALVLLALPEDQSPPKMWMIDAGPPRRVALIVNGISDNLSCFVYDPSQTFEDAPVMVFGGKLISTLHMWGPWYYVGFT